MAKHHEIDFRPNPMQKNFIESRAKADLFSSRMGEGKSAALAWSCYLHTSYNPGAKWVFVRDTWENMQPTTMKEFFKWFPPGICGSFHQTKREFTWAAGMGEGTVTFMGMDDPADASKLMSRDLAGIAIDEPAPAVTSGGVDEMIFDIGLSRLRQPGMNWYTAKLAENNPDENHWTYRRFVDPGTDGFVLWQPVAPENEQNLPESYYAELRRLWHHRPDLVRRFVDGEFGFQQTGKAVTPEWSDRMHLAVGLTPVPRVGLHLLWDFGHNPTCIVAQKTPLGNLLLLDAFVGDDIGTEELIVDAVKPLLADRYRGYRWDHIGDPAGRQREQTSIHRSAVRLIRTELGGTWRSGPVRFEERVEPLRALLNRTTGGRGVVQVDRTRCREVWQALRGGWHYHVSRGGIVSREAVKNMSSHPGDALSYGVAVLFPLGRLQKVKAGGKGPQEAVFFGSKPGLGFERPGVVLPKHGEVAKFG